MITCKLEGGLSNNLFQIANVLSLSLKYGVDYCIPLKVNNPHYEGQQPYIFPGIKYCDKEINLPLYVEKSFEYEEISFIDNRCLIGYFQSYRLIDNYREEIIRAFGFEWQLQEDMVSLQIRRGDYLNYPKIHPVVTMEYLEQAMSLFPGFKFAIFTDDPKWCKEVFGKRRDCHIESTDDELLDLVNGSCCEHNISSNSSFGWWQHWLNKNPHKKGVFPKNWFGVDLPHNTDDLYLPNSIIL